MLRIGSHVSMSAPDYLLGSVRESLENNASAMMIYTGAPQNSVRIPIEKLKVEEARQLWLSSGFDMEAVIIHAPYIVNLANLDNPDTRKGSMEILQREISRSAAIGARYLVLHPGARLKADEQQALKAVGQALDELLGADQLTVCLETMAGKGSEIGVSFEQIREIMDNCHHPLEVCLDSCHVNDAGYDLGDIDGMLKHFDEIIGLDKLHVIHVNDSKNPIGAHKDRHANIGQGTIGLEKLRALVHHPLLEGRIFILETPYIDGRSPYKQEIEMLR
ncbi:MAG: deoxyribonuclease IV [Erysipelotrichaceae bacterium]|nr:deoxyribonuclease IV [Erysipelotrichaceae bacterium]